MCLNYLEYDDFLKKRKLIRGTVFRRGDEIRKVILLRGRLVGSIGGTYIDHEALAPATEDKECSTDRDLKLGQVS